MNDPRKPDRPEGDPADRFGEVDDTLQDDAVAQVPAEARGWVAEQRFVHGLLRSLHGMDAASNEARVRAVMDAVRSEPAVRLRAVPRFVAAAAAVLLAVAGWWFLQGDRMPSAEAAVARAASVLGEEVDRRFLLRIERRAEPAEPGAARPPGIGGDAFRLPTAFEMTTRPGRRFLVTFDAVFGPITCGCDGTTVWLRSEGGFVPPRDVPLAEADALLARLGGPLELGYLDILGIVQRLPEGFELASTGRVGGGSLVRVEATRMPESMQKSIQGVVLHCDEDSGMVTWIEVQCTGRKGESMRITMEYQGTVELPASAYSIPN